MICGIVMIFLISLEETTLQGSKVFSQFCGPEVKPIKTDLTLSTAFIPSQVKKKKIIRTQLFLDLRTSWGNLIYTITELNNLSY